jgi:hypothetical protein
LLDNEQVNKAYKAHTPNTFYLLDRSGEVHYATIAQEDFPKKVLGKKIKQLLKRIDKFCSYGHEKKIKAQTSNP